MGIGSCINNVQPSYVSDRDIGNTDQDQGPTGRGFLLWDGTGRVLAKKFRYRDGSGWVMRQF